jgi:hypothetical protein
MVGRRLYETGFRLSDRHEAYSRRRGESWEFSASVPVTKVMESPYTEVRLSLHLFTPSGIGTIALRQDMCIALLQSNLSSRSPFTATVPGPTPFVT